MTKIVITGDIHLGYPNKLDDVLYSLTAIRKHMQVEDIKYCVILGDLFHTRQGVATDVMHRTYEFFSETKEKYNQSWAVFPGNHDMFLKHSWKIHSLKALSNVINVYEKPCVISIEGSRFWILPYIHDEALYMKAVDKISKQCELDDVLLTHVGVCGAVLNECFLHKNWSFVTFSDFPLNVYSGHFHCTQQVGKLWYPGSPIPFTYSEGLVSHGFFVYDTDKRTHEFIETYNVAVEGLKAPPLYATVVDKDVDNMKEESVSGNKVRVLLSHEYTTDERVALKQKLLDMGALEVAWMKTKDQEVELTKIDQGKFSLTNPDELIKAWYELDKPEHITLETLVELNRGVISKAKEIMVDKGMETEEEDA